MKQPTTGARPQRSHPPAVTRRRPFVHPWTPTTRQTPRQALRRQRWEYPALGKLPVGEPESRHKANSAGTAAGPPTGRGAGPAPPGASASRWGTTARRPDYARPRTARRRRGSASSGLWAHAARRPPRPSRGSCNPQGSPGRPEPGPPLASLTPRPTHHGAREGAALRPRGPSPGSFAAPGAADPDGN